jgi:hypothetical protein
MTFAEFHQWFRDTDAALNGKPPHLKLWWELKARLDAVVGPNPDPNRENRSPAAAPFGPSSTQPPSEIADVADVGVLQPIDAWGGPFDDDDLPPTGLTVYEQALQTLRTPGRASRPRP